MDYDQRRSLTQMQYHDGVFASVERCVHALWAEEADGIFKDSKRLLHGLAYCARWMNNGHEDC